MGHYIPNHFLWFRAGRGSWRREEGKGDRWVRNVEQSERGQDQKDYGAANRVGLKNLGSSLYLVVSKFNCLRLIMKLLKIGISVFCIQFLVF